MFCRECCKDFPNGKNYCPKCGTAFQHEAFREVSATGVSFTKDTWENAIQQAKKIMDTVIPKVKNIVIRVKQKPIYLVPVVVIIIGLLIGGYFVSGIMAYPSSNQIKQDLIGKEFSPQPKDAKFKILENELKSIKVTRKSRNKQEYTDDMYVNVDIQTSQYKLAGNLEMIYSDKNGNWVLENGALLQGTGDFKYTPLVGVSESDIKTSLIGQKISIASDNNWIVKNGEIKKLNILSRDIKLDQDTESIVAELTLQNLLSTSGKAQLDFTFQNGKWVISNIKKLEGFSVTANEQLQPGLVGATIKYIGGYSHVIKPDSIKSLKVNSFNLASNGKVCTVDATIDLSDNVVKISGGITINIANATEGWKITDILIKDGKSVTSTLPALTVDQIKHDLNGFVYLGSGGVPTELVDDPERGKQIVSVTILSQKDTGNGMTRYWVDVVRSTTFLITPRQSKGTFILNYQALDGGWKLLYGDMLNQFI